MASVRSKNKIIFMSCPTTRHQLYFNLSYVVRKFVCASSNFTVVSTCVLKVYIFAKKNVRWKGKKMFW